MEREQGEVKNVLKQACAGFSRGKSKGLFTDYFGPFNNSRLLMRLFCIFLSKKVYEQKAETGENRVNGRASGNLLENSHSHYALILKDCEIP